MTRCHLKKKKIKLILKRFSKLLRFQINQYLKTRSTLFSKSFHSFPHFSSCIIWEWETIYTRLLRLSCAAALPLNARCSQHEDWVNSQEHYTLAPSWILSYVSIMVWCEAYLKPLLCLTHNFRLRYNSTPE